MLAESDVFGKAAAGAFSFADIGRPRRGAAGGERQGGGRRLLLGRHADLSLRHEPAESRGAFVFYGTGPESPEAVARIGAPVHGFYGGNDARVNATIPKSEELMKQAGKTYVPVTYAGAGHGFMRSGDDPAGSAANKKARDEAWVRWKDLQKKI